MMSASVGSPGAPGAPKSMASRVMQWFGRLGGSLTRVALGLVGLAFLTGAGALVFVSQTVVGRQAVADLVEGALEGTVNGEVLIGPILGGNLLSHLFHLANVARLEAVSKFRTGFLRARHRGSLPGLVRASAAAFLPGIFP